MYSGKIAVPPGGGGIRDSHEWAMADSHWNLKVGVGKDSRKSDLETPILIRETWLNIYTTFTHTR
jgi:hypothetical protein